jgi:hypothetical protein
MNLKTENEELKQSEHWYDIDGNPRYDADLRMARKHNLVPSVTTILKILAQPGLDSWKLNEAILAALTLPRIADESEQTFAKRVLEDSASHAKTAAGIGTALHDWAENYVKKTPVLFVPGYEKSCFMLQEWIDENIDSGFAEESFVNIELGYAGKIDFYGKLKDGRMAFVDWKGQGIKAGKRPIFYDKWVQQLSAYAQGKDVTLISVAIGTIKENQGVWVKEWSQEEKEKGWRIFKLCLQLWQTEKEYKPK